MGKTAALLLAGLLVSACAGTPFSFDQAREVKVGMTEPQVEQLMGKPYLVTTRGNQEIWVYSFANAFGGAKEVSYVFVDGKVTQVPTIPASFK